MIKVKVLFFALAREIVGTRECIITLSNNDNDNNNDNNNNITTEMLMNELCILYPSLLKILNQITLAINKAYIFESTILKDGDEVALIPPISGG